MDYNGYLPKQICQFLHQVKDELETYQKKSKRTRVLLFPPLPSRLRYLIHNQVEDLPNLTTFSVGESWCRRVVVCHSELRDEVEEDIDSETNNSTYEEPKPATAARSRGPKRPDKPLYMPRAARERMTTQNSHGPSGDYELASPVSSSNSCISSSDSCYCPETTENTKTISTSGQECPPSVTDAILNHVGDSPEVCPQGPMLHEAEPTVCDETTSCFADMTLEEDENDEEDLDSVGFRNLTEEIKAHLKEAVTVSIEQVHNDYSLYVNVGYINPDEFRHVIEIYDFPVMFKTDNLLDAFTEYRKVKSETEKHLVCPIDGGIKIKWIDNTHALGVFSSESAAIHALSICHPLLKTRALTEGSKKAKAKAIRCAEFIQPVKERPRTDCAVAQRMVTRALGLQGRNRVQRF